MGSYIDFILPEMAKDPRMVHKRDKTVLRTVHSAHTTATPIFLPFNSTKEILFAVFTIFRAKRKDHAP